MTSLLFSLTDWSAALCGGKDHFLCVTGICIPQKLVCNGYNDCDDWSDETHCGETHARTHLCDLCEQQGEFLARCRGDVIDWTTAVKVWELVCD